MKCVSNHKNAMSLAGQKMATMTGAVLARFVAQVRGVAFYSLSVWSQGWRLRGVCKEA